MTDKQKNLFGFTDEEAKKYKDLQDIKPTFNLSQLEVGQTAKFKITSKTPRTISVTDEDAEGGKRDVPVIEVIDKLTGMENTLWISGMSLKIQFSRLFEKHSGNLKDLDIVVAVREYEHEKYGKTRAYNIQEDLSEKAETSTE